MVHIASNARRNAQVGLVMLLGTTLACREDPSPPAPVVVPFESMVTGAATVLLEAKSDDSLAAPSAALVSANEVVMLDQGRAEVLVYRRSDGAYLRTVASPGDRPGEVRRPHAVVRLDSGQYVILDQARRVLSFRDSLGAVVRETRVSGSFLTALVGLPEEHHLLIAGDVNRTSREAKGRDLHEVDYGGQVVSSYAKSASPRSKWEGKFRSIFAARMGTTIVTGSLSSNRLRFYDKRTGKERRIEVAAGWYAPLRFPSDRELQRDASPQSVAERVTAWARQQRLMNGIFPLEGGRFLARFMTFTPEGARVYHYAIADTTGKTYSVSEGTRAQVVATSGDTVFWLNRGAKGRVELGSAVASLDLATRDSTGRAEIVRR